MPTPRNEVNYYHPLQELIYFSLTTKFTCILIRSAGMSTCSKEGRTHSSLAQDLPEDILTEIFTRLHPTAEKSISITEAPLSLTRVCRAWRNVALEISSLWTNLILERKLGRLDPYRIISMWFVNSKSRLLNVVMQTASWTTTVVNRDRCLRLLVDNFHRFRSFSGRLDSPLERILCSRLGYGQIEAPNLVFFSIFFKDRLPVPIQHLRDCIASPALTVLRLEHCLLTELVFSALPHITHLTVNPELWSRAFADFAFLSYCQNLTTLEMGLHNDIIPPRMPQPGFRLRLNMLHNLRLYLNRGHNPWLFMDTISAHNLRHLEIVQKQVVTNDVPVHTLRMNTLYAFMHGSNRQLQCLSLTAIVIDNPTRLTHLLRELPNLTSLTLRQCVIHDPIIIELTASRRKTVFQRRIICPRLTNVDFGESAFTSSLLVQMIQNRSLWNSGNLVLAGVDCLSVVDIQSANPSPSFNAFQIVLLQRLMQEDMGRLKILF